MQTAHAVQRLCWWRPLRRRQNRTKSSLSLGLFLQLVAIMSSPLASICQSAYFTEFLFLFYLYVMVFLQVHFETGTLHFIFVLSGFDCNFILLMFFKKSLFRWLLSIPLSIFVAGGRPMPAMHWSFKRQSKTMGFELFANNIVFAYFAQDISFHVLDIACKYKVSAEFLHKLLGLKNPPQCYVGLLHSKFHIWACTVCLNYKFVKLYMHCTVSFYLFFQLCFFSRMPLKSSRVLVLAFIIL